MQRILIVALFIVILAGCGDNAVPDCKFSEGDIVTTISDRDTVIGHVYQCYYREWTHPVGWEITVRMLNGMKKGFREMELIRVSAKKRGKYER